MAYKTTELEKKALEAIREHNLYFIDDLIAYLPCSGRTFYYQKLQELQSIKEALTNNKIAVKIKCRKKWDDSDNPTLQLALYRLIATPEEYDRINTQKFDHTSKGESIRPIQIIVSSKENAGKLENFMNYAGKLN